MVSYHSVSDEPPGYADVVSGKSPSYPTQQSIDQGASPDPNPQSTASNQGTGPDPSLPSYTNNQGTSPDPNLPSYTNNQGISPESALPSQNNTQGSIPDSSLPSYTSNQGHIPDLIPQISGNRNMGNMMEITQATGTTQSIIDMGITEASQSHNGRSAQNTPGGETNINNTNMGNMMEITQATGTTQSIIDIGITEAPQSHNVRSIQDTPAGEINIHNANKTASDSNSESRDQGSSPECTTQPYADNQGTSPGANGGQASLAEGHQADRRSSPVDIREMSFNHLSPSDIVKNSTVL